MQSDIEYLINSVSEVYFFLGFLSGFLVCAAVIAFVIFLNR